MSLQTNKEDTCRKWKLGHHSITWTFKECFIPINDLKLLRHEMVLYICQGKLQVSVSETLILWKIKITYFTLVLFFNQEYIRQRGKIHGNRNMQQNIKIHHRKATWVKLDKRKWGILLWTFKKSLLDRGIENR